MVLFAAVYLYVSIVQGTMRRRRVNPQKDAVHHAIHGTEKSDSLEFEHITSYKGKSMLI